jgi:hypothetical protein
MKLTIKEIKERGEDKDKIDFKATVKTVYPGVEAKTKYSNYRQNIMVKDETDEIKVMYQYKELPEAYDKSIEGKEVEIKGTLSIYTNQKNITEKNIWGKLTFEGEEQKKAQEQTATAISKPTATANQTITPMAIRKICLEESIKFYGAHVGIKETEENVINTAKKFEGYIRGSVTSKPKVEAKPIVKEDPIEKKELPKNETKQAIVPDQGKIKLINEVMELKEAQGVDDVMFNHYSDGKDIKVMSIEELRILKDKLKSISEEIPF